MARKRVSVVLLMLPLAGCAHAPAFDILGSFFPVWIFCILIGIAGALAMRYVVFRRLDGLDYGPPVLVYPSLVVMIACISWLLLFR